MSLKQVYLAHVVEMVEHERGWGSKPDGKIAFHDVEAARLFIYEKTKNYKGAAPDYYVSYQYLGVCPIPDKTAKLLNEGSPFVYFD